MGCRLLRPESLLQADGVILCAGCRNILARKMHIPRKTTRASALQFGPSDAYIFSRVRLFVGLALVTISTFLILFLPFLPPFTSLSEMAQPIIRIFPFSRGVFEDKVSNFWCATNVLIKWRHWASRGALVKLSTLLTVLGFAPGVAIMYNTAKKLQAARKLAQEREIDNQPPFLALLPYALLTSSLSFFLFSFQVHEKTVLLPLLPMTLLLSGAPIDSPTYAWGALVNNVAVFRYISATR